MEYRLDDIDKRILYYLAQDARNTSAPDIAGDVNVSAGTIRNRIKQLESRGILEGYRARIDYERAEGLLTNLLTCTTSATERSKLAKQVVQIPGVVHVREVMTGHGDLRVKAVGEDSEDLVRISQSILELGIEIEDENLIRREHYQPYRAYGPENARRTPSITDFMSLGGEAEVVELTVIEGARITDTSLREANERDLLDEDVLVIAIEREGNIITPRGTTRVHAGDVVTLFVRNGMSRSLETVFSAADGVEQSA